MKNKSFWLLAMIWMAAAFWIFPRMNAPVDVVPVGEAIAEIQQLEEKAGDDKDQLKAVVKQYEKLAGNKQYKKSEEAAEALLRVGIIQEDKLDDSKKAVHTYQRLVRDHSPEKVEAAARGQERLTALQIKIDEDHSDEWGYKAIHYLVTITGANPAYSYALALLIITIIFKAVTTPLSHAQFKSMKEMQKIQPLLREVQEKYKGNQQELGKRTMDLYKEHGINPLSSCLPLLLQMPILIGLYYKVILPYSYQFTQGKLLWIGSSLAERFPGIVALNLSMPDIPLLIIYTLSMIISQKLSIVDPTQAQQQKIMAYTMPIVFAFVFRTFPSAFMLYWLFFNIISTIQQYQILHKPDGPGGPGMQVSTTSGTVAAAVAPAPQETVQKPVTNPGKKSRRRKKKFNRKPSRPVMQPIPGVS